MFNHLFSFEGRIRRTEYGLSLIFYFIAYFFIVASGTSTHNNEGSLSGLLFIPLVWFFLAQGTKRCHDLGTSGWYQLIPFYSLFLLFQDGQKERNKYGDNPKANSEEENRKLSQTQNSLQQTELMNGESSLPA